MAVPKLDASDGSYFPCISNELIKWENTVVSKLHISGDLELGTCLLRCQAKSSRELQTKSISRGGRTESISDGATSANYLHSLLKPFSSSWQYLRYTWDMWRVPPETLIAYAHLRNQGCPWKIGYLTSEMPNVSEVYVVTDVWMEAIQVSCKNSPLLATGNHTAEAERDVLKELINHVSLTVAQNEIESDFRPHASSDPSVRRWKLAFADPWPSWRCLAFNSKQVHDIDNSRADVSSRLAAIAYSNGSVEIINLSSTAEDEEEPLTKLTKRARIFIPAPYCEKSVDPKLSLFPVVYITFFGNQNLLVCHFRGHVDLWHLDWSAKRFPARLMTRLCPGSILPSSPSGPTHGLNFTAILAADFDAQSGTLLLASFPKSSGILRERLALQVYQLSQHAPFIQILSKSDKEEISLTTLLSNQFHSCKVMLGHALNRVLRVSSLAQQQDAAAFVRINSSTSFYTAAVLQVSGGCSIWSLPELEPICIVIGTDISPQMALSTSPSDVSQQLGVSRPFRLTWWNSRSKDGGCAQLTVLRENGELNVLEHTDVKTCWLTLPDHQLREIGLHAYATFAHTDAANASDASHTDELLVVDFGAGDEDSSSDTHEKNNGASGKRSVIRAIQLASTTETGLFCHFIHSGRYEEAISLAHRYNLDVELVYQQQWIRLSVQPPYLADFDNLIKSTLGLIKHRPLWVIQQCLLYLPPTSSSSLISSEQLFHAMRSLLNHGLARVRSLTTESTPVSKDTLSLIEQKLLQQLEHISSVETLLSYAYDHRVSGTEPHSTVYDLRALVFSLRTFRRRALLDIALEYAHAGQFRIVQQMMNRYPRSIGRYRLAITASLPETTNPILYVDSLLDPGLSTAQAEASYAAHTELERLAVERYQASYAEFAEPLEDGLSQVAYAKRLASWLIHRALAIDVQTGLTSYALSLTELGGAICWRIFRAAATDDSELATSLFKLRRLRWDLALLTEIVYRKSDNSKESVNPSRTTAAVYSKSKSVVLARFRLKEFQRLTVEDRLDMLLQLRLGKLSSEMIGSDRTALDKCVVDVWNLIIPYIIHYSGSAVSKRFNDLMTYCMLRITAIQGLGALNRLLTLQADILDNVVKPSNDVNQWWSNTDVSSPVPAIPFLRSLLHVIHKHEPPLKSENPSGGIHMYAQDLTTLAKRTKSHINSLRKASSADRESLKQISNELRLLERCTTSMVEFCDLIRTLENRLHRPVRIGFKSVGQLMDASRDGSAFHQLLAHWMAVATSLAQCENIRAIANSNVLEPEVPLSELTEALTRLHDILKAMFVDSPAEQWLSLGFRFSLLAAGNARLFAVSKTLQLSGKVQTPGSDQSSFLICLLLALRAYVDASVPASFTLDPASSRSLPSHTDPNERLARYCLEMFRASHSSSVPALIEAFELEEQLLDVASFLLEIRQSTSTQLLNNFPTVPRQLRPLWLDSDHATGQRRQAMFLASLSAILTERSRSKRLLTMLEPHNLTRIGQLFRLTPGQSIVCFLKTLYTHVASSQYEWYTDELMPRALNMLTNAVSSKDGLYWFVCAQWAGYMFDERFPTTALLSDGKHRLRIDSPWTCLHALYGIGGHSSNLNTFSTERVERFRVCLARFALAYCPVKHITQVSTLVAVAMHRLARSQSLSQAHKHDSLTTLKNVSKSLGHLIREHWSPSRSPEREQSVGEHFPRKYVPDIYLPIDSLEPDSILVSITGAETRVPPEDLALWMFYLQNWINPTRSSTSVTDRQLDFSCIRTVFVDTRLSLAIASIYSHLPLQASTERLATFYEQLNLLSPCESITFAESLNHAIFAKRLKFLLGLCTLPLARDEIAQQSPAGCFPSGSILLSALRASSNTWLHQWSCEAVFTCLAQRLKSILPHVDLALFDSDQTYRVDVVLSLSRSQLRFGLRLALFSRVPLEDCMYARLTTLFVDMQVETREQQAEVFSIFSWVCQFPDGQKRFIEWSETAIYPWLMTLTSLSVFFDMLSEAPSSTSVANLLIQTHRQILSVLQADTGCLELFRCLSYAKFISLLLSHMDDPRGDNLQEKVAESFREHTLYPYLKSKPVVDGVTKILSILSSSNCRTVLTAVDLFAMYSLHTLDDHVESVDIGSKVSALLPVIAPGDADSKSCLRLATWLTDVLFSQQSRRFTALQRRAILSETVKFLKTRIENRRDNSSEWHAVLDRIVKYQSQLNRVIDQLSHIQFPPHSTDPEHEQSDTEELHSGFYSLFLTVRPDQPEVAIQLFRQLIHSVCTDHSVCSDHADSQPNARCLREKLQWFCDHLASCLRALDVKTEVCLQVMVDAVASSVPPSVSALEVALNKLVAQTQPSHDEPVDFCPLYMQFVKNAALIAPGDSARSMQLRLLGAVLANERIRRSQGPRLVRNMLDTFEANNHGQTALVIFRWAIHAMCDNSTMIDAAVDNFKADIERIVCDSKLSTAACSAILIPVESFIRAKCSDFDSKDNEDSIEGTTISEVHKSIEFVQTVIELTLLLLCPAECTTDSQKPDDAIPDEQIKLWSCWLDFGIQCGVFTTSEAGHWLLHQWTTYGSPPPRGLACAGLHHLQTLVSSGDIQDYSPPIFPTSLLLSACLCQPDRSVVQNALNILSALHSPQIEHAVDMDVCLQLICLHGQLWPQLVTSADMSDKLASSINSCPSFFTRVLQSLERHVPNMRTDRRRALIQHSLQLLRQANLWVEAARLCRLDTESTCNLVSLSALVGLVRQLTNK